MNSGQLTEHAEATDADDERPEPSSDGGETVVQNDEPTLTTDTLFELLKNRRRRDTIQFLEANDGESTLSDLAEHIAAKENDLPIERISSKQRKRVYISLYQCHLPKMDRAGVIDFEKDRGTIELGPGATQLYPYLHATEDPQTGTSLDTLAEQPMADRVTAPSSALAGVGIAGLAGVAGVPGFDLLTPAAWVVVCALCLLGVAALPVVAE